MFSLQYPDDWETVPFTAVHRFNKGISITKAELVENGIAVINYGQIHAKNNLSVTTNPDSIRFAPANFDIGNVQPLKVGDLVFADTSEDRAGIGAFVRFDLGGTAFPGYHTLVARPHERFRHKYFSYLYLSDVWRDQVRQSAMGVKVYSITQSLLKQATILVPPEAQQNRIVQFLDHETAKIDHLIAKQRELIALTESRLKLWRERSFWGEAQTENPFLNPPAGWMVLRNRHLLEHVDVRSETGDEEMLSVSHITGVTPRSMKNVNMFEAESTVGYKLVAKNELVINTMWAWMGALGVSAYEGIVSPAYNVYRFRDLDAVNPMYFDCMYRTDAYVSLMKAHSRGIWESRLRLYPEVFLRLSSLVPPKDVQDRLVAENNERTAEAEKLITHCHQAIELLQERRSALITAAVTGQIEV